MSLEDLEKHNVFFSSPLDFDMLMISSFSNLYEDNGQSDSHENLVKAVLGENGNESEYVFPNTFFSDNSLRKYRNLFKSRSKVASHYLVCDKIKDMDATEFQQKCPDVLSRLVNRICDILSGSHISNGS